MPVIPRRKKPVTVDTLEWTGDNPEEMRAFCGDAFDWRPEWTARIWNTQEGCAIDMQVGHHVVRGPLGEFYPLSPAALELTYEPPVPVDRDELLRRSEEDGARARRAAADDLTRLDEEIGCLDWPTLSHACFGNRCSECGGCFECPCHGSSNGREQR